jgi:hypothetical protein
MRVSIAVRRNDLSRYFSAKTDALQKTNLHCGVGADRAMHIRWTRTGLEIGPIKHVMTIDKNKERKEKNYGGKSTAGIPGCRMSIKQR